MNTLTTTTTIQILYSKLPAELVWKIYDILKLLYNQDIKKEIDILSLKANNDYVYSHLKHNTLYQRLKRANYLIRLQTGRRKDPYYHNDTQLDIRIGINFNTHINTSRGHLEFLFYMFPELEQKYDNLTDEHSDDLQNILDGDVIIRLNETKNFLLTH